ncbi:50S ribosomal protein L5 [Patescibacteria group bacterium]|nr:50S ribosomal protein L5 [Patescibacteria group bacterium]MDQ5919656.1 large subunit ribosomal protein [Patescibacteria group bacterium]
MSLQERYQKEVVPTLKKELGITNLHAVPKVTKVVISVGLSQGLKDPKVLEAVEQTLVRITGQKPVKTKAKKAISNFKIREGMVVGMMVTLRGQRMWDFLTRLTQTTFPRIRDFRGVSPKIIDAQGNASFGFREHIAFPEIRADEVERLHGLQVTVATTAGDKKTGLMLLQQLGFPFNA